MGNKSDFSHFKKYNNSANSELETKDFWKLFSHNNKEVGVAVHNPGTHNISEIEFEVPFVGVVNPYELKIEI
mgnify:CR=1 FL=1